MDVQIKVYLNEGEGRFMNFNSAFNGNPRLRLAAAFTIATEIPIPAVRELVFEQLNVGGDLVPAAPWTNRYRADRNRSLSVGDVVVLGEVAYGCASSGWEIVPTERLVEAIGNFNEAGAFAR